MKLALSDVLLLCLTFISAGLSFLILGLAVGSTRLSRLNKCSHAAQQCARLPPISIIVPVYNEQTVIVQTIQALLALDYELYEIIIVNDGSTDKTLDVLHQTFDLYQVRPPQSPSFQAVEHLFASHLDPKIIVLDKENGGKSDALNIGIAVASYEWFCSVDADTLLMPDALRCITLATSNNPSAVAATGQVRVGYDHFPQDTGRKWLTAIQSVEYIRAFVIERIGWNMLKALVIVPGAFGLFKKEAVCEVGGYSSNMPSEDVELVIKLYHSSTREILYVSDAIAWTEAPSSLADLAKQRMRWYQGLLMALFKHRNMIFNSRYGRIGLIALPYLLVFELLQPIFVILLIALLILNIHDVHFFTQMLFLKLLLFNFWLQYLVTIASVIVDRYSWGWQYPRKKIMLIFVVILLERSIYNLLLVIFKAQALSTLLYSHHRGYSQWQPTTRHGIYFPTSDAP